MCGREGREGTRQERADSEGCGEATCWTRPPVNPWIGRAFVAFLEGAVSRPGSVWVRPEWYCVGWRTEIGGVLMFQGLGFVHVMVRWGLLY